MDKGLRIKIFIWTLIAILIAIHQDVWFWNDSRLLFGFLPVGLAYHMALSVAAAVVWLLAVQFAWPEELVEEVLEETAPSPSVTSSASSSTPREVR